MKLETRLAQLRKSSVKKYGYKYVHHGQDHEYTLDVIRSPSMMLDYKLGIGGFPRGHGIEIFGANRIGKSSMAYITMGNAQKIGLLPCLIAVEPRMVTPEDKEWGRALGFEPDMAHILYPDNAEEAFDMLREQVFKNLVDYIVIDSLGGMGKAAGAKVDGKKQAYGISSDVTSALNDVMPRLYKNNIGLMILNQQRQGSVPGTTFVTYESPGGEALHHHMRIRIHLKPGSQRWSANIDGEPIAVGQELTTKMKKNNLSQGEGKTAKFNFFNIATDEYGFGVDVGSDVINTGMVTGVIREEKTWFFHESFPNGQLYGRPKVLEFILNNPEAYEQVHSGVMQVMEREEAEAVEAKQKLQAKAENGTTN